ncbi:MAG: TRAP transporter small permease [Granulosicoccus sp.]
MRDMLDRLDAMLTRLERTAVGVLMSVAVIVLAADIAGRTLFNLSISWAAELTRYSIVWMVMIGASITARTGAHISIDALSEVLPERVSIVVIRAGSAIAALTCAAMAWYSTSLVMQMTQFGQRSPALEWPMWVVYLAMPVGFGLMSLRFVQSGAAVSLEQRRLDLAKSAG